MSMKQTFQTRIIKRNLLAKYGRADNQASTNRSLIYVHIINSIVQPKNFLNRYRINYQQSEIQCNSKQYCKRYYSRRQYQNKNKALTEYYKYHQNFPFQVDTETGLIMLEYQEQKNKQQRKMIKKIMNQPPSISQMDNFSGQNSTSKCIEKIYNSFSLKLRQLDNDRSSIIFQEICQKINVALQDVKPLYFYKGVYDDGVKQFKKFIISKKENNFRKNKQSKNFLRIKPREKDKKDTNNHYKSDQNKQENSKQNSQKLSKFQQGVGKKYETNQNLRRTLGNMNGHSTIKSMNKKQFLSRSKRNKTLTIKPQSFSKTTQHQVVSKQEQNQHSNQNNNNNKKRVKSSIRVRNCKSVNKIVSVANLKNKSTLKLTKNCQNQIKMMQNQSKSFNMEKQKQKQQVMKSKIGMQSSSLTKSKRLFKKLDQKQREKLKQRQLEKIPTQRSLTRQQSRPKLSMGTRQKNASSKNSQNDLNNLIKNKLKLRA